MDLKYVDLLKLTENKAKLIAKSISKVKKLNLNNTNITPYSLIALLTEAKSLEELDLTYVNLLELNENKAKLIAKSISKVKKFNLNNSNINPDSLTALLTNANSLEELDLANVDISELTDEQAKIIAKSISKVKKLNLNTTNITPDSLISLLTKAKSLEELDLGNNDFPNITSDQAKTIGELLLPKIKKLDVTDVGMNQNELKEILPENVIINRNYF